MVVVELLIAASIDKNSEEEYRSHVEPTSEYYQCAYYDIF
jgi:hypothetical protein